jgi:hypothetical protein
MNICPITDEYMEPVPVNPDDPYIHQFQDPTDEYNLNIFIGTDEFKILDEEMPFSYSVSWLSIPIRLMC